MANLLHDKKGKETSDRFGKISVLFSITTLLILIKVISYLPKTLVISDDFPPVPNALIYSLFASCCAGMIFTILSFRKKEEALIPKWLGAIINVQFFLLIVGAMLLFRFG